ncbi:hypothetical protein [Marinobacter salarius]|uniref:hypothetical protein n=1 Tax=Marinobacter salarius TaxID=1420917 RepID=UPI003D0E6D51
MSKGGGNDIEDTPEQRYLAQVAAEKWNFAQEELAPLENKYMESVDDMDSESKMSYIRGRTMQAQTQAQSQAQNELSKGQGRAGINPNSGRAQGDQTGLALDIAEAGGENLGRAQFEQDNQKIMGLQNVTAIGQGQSGRAQAGLSRMAQESSNDAVSDAKQAFNRRSANLQLVGTVAGAGTRYGLENNWGLASANKPEQYGMNADFDTGNNRFGLDDSAGGFYDFAGGY